MSKKLKSSPKILAALAKATDNAVEFDTVSVYETISLNVLPIKQRGLFNGAVVSENTLTQMAAYVNNGGAVPLHTMHKQGYELPVGKTFSAEVHKDTNGQAQLRSLFYLPNSEVDLINKLETDVINEVSVGMQTLHVNCSECGWDYLSAESTFSNLYNGECANEHVIGEKGVHVILNGLDRWLEQSLVSLGAANGARIQARTKALMGAENYEKLAASGHVPEITVLYATQNMTEKEAENMDLKELVTELTNEKVKVIGLTTQLATSEAALVTATAALTAANAQVVTLTASVNPDLAPLNVKLTAALEASTKAHNVIFAEASRLCVALSIAVPAQDTPLADLMASIESNRTKMSSQFPAGGVMLSAVQGFSEASVQKSAFKGA